VRDIKLEQKAKLFTPIIVGGASSQVQLPN